MVWAQAERVLPDLLGDLLRSLRPWQWYKQGVMLLGLVFSKSVLEPAAWLWVGAGVVAFTCVSSAVYLFNDISDIEEDRQHPRKCHRPIASGALPVWLASVAGVGLIAAGLTVGYYLGAAFSLILIAYVVQNAVYSIVLKDVVLVDIMLVAIGFVLRAIAGAVAITVFVSPWLIVCTFLLALVLALGKRRQELLTTGGAADSREALAGYDQAGIDQLLMMSMAVLLMSYSLYTFSRADPAMMATLPFAFFAIFRYHHLVHASDIAGQPEYLLTDAQSITNLLLWGTLAVLILYDGHQILLSLLP